MRGFDFVTWLDEVRDLCNDIKTKLETNPSNARQTLRRLLTTPITVTPTVVDGVVSFDFVGSASWMEYPGGTSPYWEYDEGYNTKDLHDYSSTPQAVVRAIAGRITRPDHTVVRTHSASGVHQLATSSILSILQGLPPVGLVGRVVRDGRSPVGRSQSTGSSLAVATQEA